MMVLQTNYWGHNPAVGEVHLSGEKWNFYGKQHSAWHYAQSTEWIARLNAGAREVRGIAYMQNDNNT